MSDNKTFLRMTVIRDDGNNLPTIEEINLDEVDMIETVNRKIVYHIGDVTYYQITNRSDLDDILSKRGFDNLDKSNLVNLRKIRNFDEELGKVYFTENPNKDSKFALVARIKYKFVANLIKRIVAHNNGTTTEMKIDTKGLKSVLKGLF